MIKYDKLKNLDVDEEKFKFSCPSCKINGMKKGVWEVKPINIPWKPDFVDNTDIVNDDVRIQMNNLPTLRQAILEACNKAVEGKFITIKCLNCNNFVPIYNKMDVSEMRKWLNRNLEQYLDLRLKENDTRRTRWGNNLWSKAN